jgi:Flp pilus assembly protein TadD
MSRRGNREARRLETKQVSSVGATQASVSVLGPSDPVEARIVRARKLRSKGDRRRALVLLREACALDAWRARPYAILGALCVELGLREEAARAFKQACWLQSRAGEHRRAEVTAKLLEELVDAA